MKSNKTKSAMTALVIAAMICTAAMPVKAEETKWENNNGVWSLVKADGKKATGWVKDGDCWYAFDENGAMRTGWVASNEHWYYMGESGVMQAGAWVEDNGAQYFIKGTGVMAKDYIKDGYELLEDGRAVPLTETGSVVVTDPSEVEGQVIEGNLYVDVTTAKELELKGVTVKGKLIIIGDNETAGKVTLTDSKVETIHTQSRNAEIVLSGDTDVKNIVMEETAKVTPDKGYKGEVENFEIQSTAKGEVVIEVPAGNVSTNTYAGVDIQAPVENLEVKKETEVKVNSDVKNLNVAETAKDTKVDVAKGNTIEKIVADAPVKIDGKGTVEKVEANVDGVEAGKDTTIKDVETGKDVTDAPDVTKPDTGGSSGGSGGGDYTPTIVTRTVSNKEDLIIAVNDKSIDRIVIEADISLENDTTLTIPKDRKLELSINQGVTLTLNAKKSEVVKDEDQKNVVQNYSGITIEGDLTLTGSGTVKNSTSYFTVYVADTGNFVLNGVTIIGRITEQTNETVKVFGKMRFESGVIGDAIANADPANINNHFVLGIGVGEGAELIMNGGTINSSWFGISTNGTQSGQKITINDGTINCIGDESNIFYIPKAEFLIINGGTFNGTDGGLEMRQGTLEITGGTFTTTSSKDNSAVNWGNGESGSFWSTIALGKPNNHAYAGNLIVNISGATIKAPQGADAIIVDTRYNVGNADRVEISISGSGIDGNVKICEGNVLKDWTAIDGKYSYTYQAVENGTPNTSAESTDENTNGNQETVKNPEDKTAEPNKTETSVETPNTTDVPSEPTTPSAE